MSLNFADDCQSVTALLQFYRGGEKESNLRYSQDSNQRGEVPT
jgi:hypothetical protein